MPFVLVRYDNRHRFFTLEAPVELTRELAKRFREVDFQMKSTDESRVTGELARTGCSLRLVLNAIEEAGWSLTQASTGGSSPGALGTELYVFSKSGADSKRTDTGQPGSGGPTLMLPPPPVNPKGTARLPPCGLWELILSFDTILALCRQVPGARGCGEDWTACGKAVQGGQRSNIVEIASSLKF